MIRAVVFDFDGLILDTESPEFSSWEEEFRAHSLVLSMDDYSKCVGAGPDAWSIVDHFRSMCSADIDQALDSRHKRFLALMANPQPLPGVLDWIEMLEARSIPIGIASSSLRVWVEGYLVQMGLRERFSVICTRSEHRAKPAPDLYLAACRELGVDPSEALALEDSRNGLIAAKSAGMKAVAVPNQITRTFDLSLADLVLDSLAEKNFDEVCQILA